MVLFNKPFMLEFNSWCFSFRFAYGDEGGAPHPPEKAPAQGMGFRIDGEESEADGEDRKR